MLQLTREEIAEALARKYLGKVILLPLPGKPDLCGRVTRITCETATKGEPMAIFSVNQRRHEVDVNYLVENVTICSKDTNATPPSPAGSSP